MKIHQSYIKLPVQISGFYHKETKVHYVGQKCAAVKANCLWLQRSCIVIALDTMSLLKSIIKSSQKQFWYILFLILTLLFLLKPYQQVNGWNRSISSFSNFICRDHCRSQYRMFQSVGKAERPITGLQPVLWKLYLVVAKVVDGVYILTLT